MADDDELAWSDDEETQHLSHRLNALGIDELMELSDVEDDDRQDNEMEPDTAPVQPAAHLSTAPPTTSQHHALHQVPAEQSNGSVSLAPANMDQEGEELGEILEDPVQPGQSSQPACPSRQGQHGDGDAGTGQQAASEILCLKPSTGVCYADKALNDLLSRPLETDRKCAGRKRGRQRANHRARQSDPDNPATLQELANYACKILVEPKYYLMCRIIASIGSRKTKGLLREVQGIQDNGGMRTADGLRFRTSGGIFFTLLKPAMDPKVLKEIYADDTRRMKELRARPLRDGTESPWMVKKRKLNEDRRAQCLAAKARAGRGGACGLSVSKSN